MFARLRQKRKAKSKDATTTVTTTAAATPPYSVLLEEVDLSVYAVFVEADEGNVDIRFVDLFALEDSLDDACVDGVVLNCCCVLTSGVVGRETVVVTDVDPFGIDTNIEIVVDNCVLPLTVVIGAPVVNTVDSVVIGKSVVGLLVVAESLVDATVVRDGVRKIAVEGEFVIEDLLDTVWSLVTTEVVAAVVDDKVVGFCVVYVGVYLAPVVDTVDSVVIGKRVVGLLVVERSLVTATVVEGDRETTKLAVEGEFVIEN